MGGGLPCVVSAARLQPCHLREPRQLGARAHTEGLLGSGLVGGGLGRYFSLDFNSARCRSQLFEVFYFLFYITALYFFYSLSLHRKKAPGVHVYEGHEPSQAEPS